MDSLQKVLDLANQENYEIIPWSPTRPDKQPSRSHHANSVESWKSQHSPVPLELQGRQEGFAAASKAEYKDLSSSPGSVDQDDQEAIVAHLRKTLPTLLQENSLFRERVYAQSAIEPCASPTADHVHEKILREQSHSQTLTAEDAPLRGEHLNINATRNIRLLQLLREKEILADPLFTLPLRARPPLPATASTNEVAFLLSTQAQRRRKQIHGERTGEGVFPGLERRAVRRRLEHVTLGKDHDVWPPSAAHPPALAYSEIDEEHVAIMISSPAKTCPDFKCPIAGQITKGTTARVIRFLRAQSTMETSSGPATRAHPYSNSNHRLDSTFDVTVHTDVDSVSSGRSLYLHPNTRIDECSESSRNLQSTTVPPGYSARAASIKLIEQFPAPVSATPEEEPIKRASPPKANIAGFEEHSKRGQKRKQRPKSLTHHPVVRQNTETILRAPLSFRSRNIGIKVAKGHSWFDDTISPEVQTATDTSNPHTAAAGSQASWHHSLTSDMHDQENAHPVAEPEERAKALYSPPQSVRAQYLRSQHAARNAGPTTLDRRSSFNGQVPKPTLQAVSRPGLRPPSPRRERRHRHLRRSVVFTEEGLAKGVVYSSPKCKEGASGREKPPSSGFTTSAKAKKYLRHLNEHVDSLSRERDQAVRKVFVLEEEVKRLKLTAAVLKRELGHWEA